MARGWHLIPGPPHVKNIIAAEMCERFCYYGYKRTLFVQQRQKQWGVPVAVVAAPH
jgi:dipeptide/tripeptide permease